MMAAELDQAAATATREAAIVLSGELTIYGVAEVKTRVLEGIASGVHTIDLTGVSEIDSAGLQLLCAARHSIRAAGGAAKVIGANAALQDAAAALGMARVVADAI